MAAMVCASQAHAAYEVPAGEIGDMDGATIDLACEDLVVNGTLNASGSTFTNAGNVLIGAGGVFNANQTNIDVALGWTTSAGGVLNASDSMVQVTNACGNSATTFTGNVTFDKLSAVVSGHTVSVASGTELTVSGALTLKGVSVLKQGDAIALLTLQSGGTQDVADVGVDGVNATNGQHLAPLLDNLITGGVADNWFRGAGPTPPPGDVTPIPTMGPVGMGLMGLLIAFAAGLSRRFFARSDSH